jgi:hypothetical protein
MGSSLAPLLAEIFLQEFEKKNLRKLKNMGVLFWKRYVDDTFVLLHPKASTKVLCYKLSQLHRSLKFTSEEENKETKSLSFLDVHIERQAGIGFATRIYRKSTYSGLITRWDSFVPKRYKYNAVSTMVYRAIKICSTYKLLDEKFNFIRTVTAENGYPTAFVESIIRRQLNLVYSPRPVTPPTLATDTVVFRVPFFGHASQVYGKRISAAVAKQYPLKQIRVIYDVTARIGQNFTTKDPIPDMLKSGVVYEATCPECNDKYIGKTCRHLKTRIKEHLSNQQKFLPNPVKAPDASVKRNDPCKIPILSKNVRLTRSQTSLKDRLSNQKQFLTQHAQSLNSTDNKQVESRKATIPKKKHMTRSQIQKNQAKYQGLRKDMIHETLKNTTVIKENKKPLLPISALAKHYVIRNHLFKQNHFKILLNDKYRYRLLIKETLLIKKRKPALNATDRSLPLYIYADGLENNTKRKKQVNNNQLQTRITTGMCHT